MDAVDALWLASLPMAAAFDTVVNVGTAKRIGIALPAYFMQTVEDKVD